MSAEGLSASDLVAPLPVEEFLATTYLQRFRLFRGAAGRFSGLLSESIVLETLRRRAYDPALVTLLLQGREVPRARFCTADPRDARPRLHFGMLQGLLTSGAALIIAQLHRHHEPLARLAQTLSRMVRAEVNVNVYLGGPRSRGFDLHVDHHDVFVLQVTGRKQWYVAEPTYASPLVVPAHTGPQPTEIAWTGLLEAGDVLYMPRGVWHRAEATEETPTLHLSCGVQPCTGLHIVHWLADELMADARFRAELPRFGPRESLARHAEELKRALLERWDDDAIDRFVSKYESDVEQESAGRAKPAR